MNIQEFRTHSQNHSPQDRLLRSEKVLSTLECPKCRSFDWNNKTCGQCDFHYKAAETFFDIQDNWIDSWSTWRKLFNLPPVKKQFYKLAIMKRVNELEKKICGGGKLNASEVYELGWLKSECLELWGEKPFTNNISLNQETTASVRRMIITKPEQTFFLKMLSFGGGLLILARLMAMLTQ